MYSPKEIIIHTKISTAKNNIFTQDVFENIDSFNIKNKNFKIWEKKW